MTLMDFVNFAVSEGLGGAHLHARRWRHAQAEGIEHIPTRPHFPAQCYPPELTELE